MSFLSPIDYVTAAPPRLDDGTPLVGASRGPVCGSDRAAAISASSPNAAVAARWLDVAYSPWGKQLFNFGIEESSYELLRGEPRFREPILASHRSSLGNRSDALGDLAKYSRLPFGGPFEQSASALSQLRSLGAGYGEAGNPWTLAAVPSPDLVLTYDSERRAEYERIMTPVTAHLHANFAAFVTGQRPLEEFDRFVREIAELDVNDAVALIYQAEVDFYSKTVW
jgi:putative aldouronate transport system substrate-binding protein